MIVMLIASAIISALGIFFAHVAGSGNMHWRPRLIWTALLVLVTFGAGQGGYAIAAAVTKADAVGGYHQFLNGTVVTATVTADTCERDGDCEYHHECDPYQVPHYHYDSKGNLTSVTYTTEYHQCPYATVERDYVTTDSIGGSHDFGAYIDPKAVEWRAGVAIPDDTPRGIPKTWQKARTALDAGHGLPMTEVGEYDNYILASEDTLLKASSDDIAKLKKAKLLPEHTQNLTSPIYDTFDARKVSFVGVKPSNEATWQNAVMQFDSALGMTLRGDLHVVVIKDSLLPSGVSSEDYANAIKAYWLNDLGKYAFAKNGIMVVIGVADNGKTIDWAKSTTGMPIGNGSMLQEINLSLTGMPFTVTSVMGDTYANVTNGKATYVIGKGAIPQAVMVQFPFARACMECKDPGEAKADTFVNLPINAPVNFGGYFLTIFLVLVATGIGWGAFMFYSDDANANSESDDDESSYSSYDSGYSSNIGRMSNLLRSSPYKHIKKIKNWRTY